MDAARKGPLCRLILGRVARSGLRLRLLPTYTRERFRATGRHPKGHARIISGELGVACQLPTRAFERSRLAADAIACPEQATDRRMVPARVRPARRAKAGNPTSVALRPSRHHARRRLLASIRDRRRASRHPYGESSASG
jgi:hypothetical protein